jgi:hypothetical protein
VEQVVDIYGNDEVPVNAVTAAALEGLGVVQPSTVLESWSKKHR